MFFSNRPQVWPRFILKALCSLGLPAYMLVAPLGAHHSFNNHKKTPSLTRPLIVHTNVTKFQHNVFTTSPPDQLSFPSKKNVTLWDYIQRSQSKFIQKTPSCISPLLTPSDRRPSSSSTIQWATPSPPCLARPRDHPMQKGNKFED
jgi:hypothetical protein